uniref:Uncharacterized protein n=1 Tax=Rhipicephalus zambeziensis TaxID=60191 RepID=A0A224Y5G7_9ACAR
MQGARAPVLLFLFSTSPFFPLSPFHKSADGLRQPGALFTPVLVLGNVVRAERVDRFTVYATFMLYTVDKSYCICYEGSIYSNSTG